MELRELGSAFSNFEFCRTFQLNFSQTWVCKIDENWTDSFNKDVQAFVFCSEPVLHERANLTSWYIYSFKRFIIPLWKYKNVDTVLCFAVSPAKNQE